MIPIHRPVDTTGTSNRSRSRRLGTACAAGLLAAATCLGAGPAQAMAQPTTTAGTRQALHVPTSTSTDRAKAKATAQAAMSAITRKKQATLKTLMTPSGYRDYLRADRQWRAWLAEQRWTVLSCTVHRGAFTCTVRPAGEPTGGASTDNDQVLTVAKVAGRWKVTRIDSLFGC